MPHFKRKAIKVEPLKEGIGVQGDVSPIVGLGLKSGYAWKGEDLVEALRRLGVPNERWRAP